MEGHMNSLPDLNAPGCSQQSPAVRKRIKLADVRARYPVDPVTIWRKIKAGSFPQPHYIGSRRFWYLDEVEAWISGQIARGPEGRPSPSAPFSDLQK
jgi:predicted DNA-binding transcriptional regulator AlpA